MKYYYYIFILLFKIHNIWAGCYSPARQCVVEPGLDQNPVGWRPTMPSVLSGGLERESK